MEKETPKLFKIARFGDIINARPEGMPYKEYVEKRREQSERLKRRLKGAMVWKSGFIPSKEGRSLFGKLENWGIARRPLPKLTVDEDGR